MIVPTLPGVTATTVKTERLSTRVLFTGPPAGIPVLFLHGNATSATWWEQTMLALPGGYRGIAPDQRGYGEAEPDAKIDATRGVGDLADDARALLDYLGIDRAHLVGNSLGSIVVWRLVAQYPARWLSITQADPGSPFGFGATKDARGTPCSDDFAGSGAGLINPQLVASLQVGDRTTESPFTARSVLRTLLVKPPFVPANEDALVDSMLSTHLGQQDYPGDALPSPNWPFAGPGVFGPNNALSPKYTNEAAGVVNADPKPTVLWVRGSHDLMVSDASVADLGTIGPTGLIPGYPGVEAYPPQPMLTQIRSMLDAYRAAGGNYAEVIIDDAGHVPFIEKPDEFNQVFHSHLQENNPQGGNQ
ncbi:MAG: alpha/beta hydrolase [Acidimicrobiia bacterium]|nr:alpha/beta hydrolase [Acidimicrobiia bacterium]